MNEKLLNEYAKMAVGAGVNIKKGQNLIINAPIHTAPLARLCAKAAYDLGAKRVVVHYVDENLARINMENSSVETLCDIKPWILASYMDYIKDDGSAAVLSISSSNPEIYKGLDIQKIKEATIAKNKAMMEFREYTMASKIQWSIIAVPSEAWASKVFPELSEEEAMQKLWGTIFRVSRVEGDAISNWKEYAKNQAEKKDLLNTMNLDKLILTSNNGTNLEIGLADDYEFGGVSELNEAGVEFIPNMPTEELFTAPHKDRVNGIVYGTKPCVYSGNIINDFMFKFKDGEIIEFDAKEGKDFLAEILSIDAGAKRIGEIALVPKSSPINKENVLFYNTLFDENASCHIALGQGYPGTVVGGNDMTKEELLNKGVNDSSIHHDVMIGSDDMKIIGVTKDGKEIQLFLDGEWVI